MLLANWSPFFDVAKTFEEFDRMFEGFGRPLGVRSVPRGTFPAINIYNEGDKVILTAEMPGVDAKDIDLSVLADSISIKAERKAEANSNERYYRKERPCGTFTRTMTLGEKVDADSAKAMYDNGILTVEMKKAKEAQAKKIKIKA